MISCLNGVFYINNEGFLSYTEQMHIVEFENTTKSTHRPTLNFGLAKTAVVKRSGGIRYQTIITL